MFIFIETSQNLWQMETINYSFTENSWIILGFESQNLKLGLPNDIRNYKTYLIDSFESKILLNFHYNKKDKYM